MADRDDIGKLQGKRITAGNEPTTRYVGDLKSRLPNIRLP